MESHDAEFSDHGRTPPHPCKARIYHQPHGTCDGTPRLTPNQQLEDDE